MQSLRTIKPELRTKDLQKFELSKEINMSNKTRNQGGMAHMSSLISLCFHSICPYFCSQGGGIFQIVLK